jgi:hypothetical protein
MRLVFGIVACVAMASIAVPTAWAGRAVVGFALGPSLFGSPVPLRIGSIDLIAGTMREDGPAQDCSQLCASTSFGAQYDATADRNGVRAYVWTFGARRDVAGQFIGVTGIDGATGTINQILSTGQEARSLAGHPFQDVMLGVSRVYDSARATRIAVQPLSVLGSTALPLGNPAIGGVPVAPVFDREARYAYVVSGGVLLKLDATSGNVITERVAGFPFAPTLDSDRRLIYGTDTLGGSVVAFDLDTLDRLWSVALAAPTTTAMDRRGRLLVQFGQGAEYDARWEVAIVNPDLRSVEGSIVLDGYRFVRNSGSSKIYRVAPEGCFLSGTMSCFGDVLIEYDGRTLLETQRFQIDYRAGDDPTRMTGWIKLNWVVFLPESGNAIEFHHAALDHYFVTANPVEVDALDTGYFAGWRRTGESFNVMLSDAGTGNSYVPVCRFYGLPERGLDSHFYSASLDECDAVAAGYDGAWVRESDDAFYVVRANETTGACPEGTRPVHRLWNARFDSNHRYTTSPTIKAEMIERGYVPEGYGPDKVAFCVRA